MQDRRPSSPPALQPRQVLTGFSQADRRAQVREACLAQAPGCSVLDAATPIGAVLSLLSRPVDLVLLEAAWAGELLPALLQHVRRSAPQATVLLFGDPQVQRGVQRWEALPGLLSQVLSRGLSAGRPA